MYIITVYADDICITSECVSAAQAGFSIMSAKTDAMCCVFNPHKHGVIIGRTRDLLVLLLL